MKVNIKLCFAAGILALSVMSGALHAADSAFRLPAILSDNMVLQQDKPAHIWGWAQAGKPVVVRISGQQKSATADNAGKWSVTLDTLKSSGGPVEMTVESGGATLTVKNILIGEVWLGSGQSNMNVAMTQVNNSAAEIAAATDTKIRLFTPKFHAPAKPAEDVTGSWVVCSPETIKSFSAVAYFFGRKIHNELQVPVGLIHSSWGGTPAENWVSYETLRASPATSAIADRFDTMPKSAKGWDAQLPTGLYNGMIAPLTSLTIRGVIWYQGETNSSRPNQYKVLFPALIKQWRQSWGEEIPFYFVQLANFQAATPQPVNSYWAQLREAQASALSLPQTAMAVAIDIGEGDSIHPKNKQDVGNRLALCALAGTYGKKVEYSGPMFKSMHVEGSRIRIMLDHAEGLTAKGGTLKQFAIAGKDKKFAWATATIDGQSIIVSRPDIAEPVAVRYAWADNPEGCNLYNSAGLPAAPFRTDDWAGLSDKVSGK